MKTVKTIVKETTETVSTTCDICGTVYPGYGWTTDKHEVLETEVKLRTGKSYQEDGGWGETLSFDICPDCFKLKLIPALKELGAEPTMTEWDF